MPSKPKDTAHKLTRRQMMGAVGAATAAVAVIAQTPSATPTFKESNMSNDAQKTQRKMPVVYLPHGGGPFSYVDMGLPKQEVDPLVEYWQRVGRLRPKALLVISAHWEQPVPTVMTSAQPPMLFDYYGFPQAAYEIQWPAPGDPALASRVSTLLADAGIRTATDEERGFDHGIYIPLGRSFPNADVPCIQLSLQQGLDPQAHLDIGRALAPLRDEGVLIIGSGMSYHNMKGFMSNGVDTDDDVFDAWLQQALRSKDERKAHLLAWEKAPAARQVHPREEHLLPLMVVTGAAGDDEVSVPFAGKVFGKTVSAIHFGDDSEHSA